MNKQIIIIFVIVFVLCILGIMMLNQSHGSSEAIAGHYAGQVEETCDHNDFFGGSYSVGRTCVEWGRTIEKCLRPGCNGVRITYRKEPGGHLFGSINSTEHAATCTEDGYIEYKCTNIFCGKTKKDITQKAFGHDFDGVDKEATCITTGMRQKVCKTCGTTYGETMPKCDHDWDYDYWFDGDCKTQGFHCIRCSKCGFTYNERYSMPPVYGDHVWDEDNMIVVKEETCISAGTGKIKCKVCGREDTIEIPKDEEKHDYPDKPDGHHNPNCEDMGYDYYNCKRCGDQKIFTTEVDFGLPHTFVEESRTEPTCTTDGLLVERCNKTNEGFECGKIQETVLKAPGHKFNKDDVCTVCGYEKDLDMADILGE
ncbi:MAG: hypothetical protein IKR04_02505 [Clostridia bacterium]|nr:hypothetical protein [Clostridia bacterium]